jgi:hypothetical protein
MAGQATSNPLHMLRGLYRFLKTPPLSEELVKKTAAQALASGDRKRFNNRTNASTKYLMQRFRQVNAAANTSNTTASSSLEQNTRLKTVLAECLLLRQDLQSRAALYALDAGADQILTPRETSRRAAARAGLQLPELAYKE